VRVRSRRQFLRGSLTLTGLGLLAGCGILPPRVQPARIPRIGVLHGTSTDHLEAFEQALLGLGYVEGRDIRVEYRFAEREDQMPGFATELVREQVAVLVASNTPATRAAMQATTTIPIVMVTAAGPAESGFIASLARPGGNVTGLSALSPQLSGKRVELLKEIIPRAAHVGVLWPPTDPVAVAQWRETEVAAQALGVRLQSLEVRDPDDFEAAFAAIAGSGADALLSLQHPLIFQQRKRIIEFLAGSRVPAMHFAREFPDAGGLMALGANLRNQFQRAAPYVDKILKGAKPADLPVEQPTVFDFVINLKTAQALGLSIPPSVLQQATEIIQ
jgi:putative ABC transport system substrate-binding protein